MLATAYLQHEADGRGPIGFIVHRDVNDVGFTSRDLGSAAPELASVVAVVASSIVRNRPRTFCRLVRHQGTTLSANWTFRILCLVEMVFKLPGRLHFHQLVQQVHEGGVAGPSIRRIINLPLCALARDSLRSMLDWLEVMLISLTFSLFE